MKTQNENLVNVYSSNFSSPLITNTIIPNGQHTLPPQGSNIQSAAGIYPKGGKKNKISIKYPKLYLDFYLKHRMKRKMKRSLKRKMKKNRVRSAKRGAKIASNIAATRSASRGIKRAANIAAHMASTRSSRRSLKRTASFGTSVMVAGGQPPMATPNYPNGYSQYQNNNGSLSNTYSLGSPLAPQNSALANPPPQQLVTNANIPDNLNHNTLNAYGKIGAGSGFPSRGWF